VSEWTLAYEGYNPAEEGLREALCTLGNGYFATRGAGPEAEAGEVHYPGTYLAGGYNRLKTEIEGRVIENEDLVNMPNWLPLNFRPVGGKWFSLGAVEILDYHQELDLKRGILHRTVRFRDQDGRESTLILRRLVHMDNQHLGAQELRLIAANWSGDVEFRTGLDGRIINAGVERYQRLNSKHLEPLGTAEIGEDAIYLEAQTSQSKLRVALAARTRAYVAGQKLKPTRWLTSEPDYIAQGFTLEVKQEQEVTLDKVVALYTSQDRGISECGLEARKTIKLVGSFADLLESHLLAWEQLWRRFEIEFYPTDNNNYRDNDDLGGEDDEYTTMVLRLYMFHILQTSSMHTMDLDVGVPSRGWHGEAYRGHIFWDEIFVFPLLNFRLHEITKALLLYRYRRLNEARRHARAAGYRGALYPWQSGSSGREESQKVHLNPRSGNWIPDHTHLQYHVNLAIAYNIYQYYQVTGDLEFLAFYGAEMLLEIARFWGSIATYNGDLRRYEVLGVVGPDEYHTAYPGEDKPGLSNNAYTNLMAVWVLGRTLELFDLLPQDRYLELCERLKLGQEELDRWRDIQGKIFVPFHGDGIISQFQGYEDLEEFDWQGYRRKYDDIQRLDRILESEDDTPNRYKVSKQADVLMLFFLFSSEQLRELFEQLGYPFEYETIPKNIKYYMERTSHGSTLSRVVYSWVLARSDRVKSWKLFTQALRSDIADIQGGTTPEGIHLGAMAGVVDLMQRAYTGVEVRGQVLYFSPLLPEELGRLLLRIRYRFHSLEVEITPEMLRITALEGPAGPIRIGVKGEVFELKMSESKEVRLR
jgi:alpha,alpha-trehalase